MNTTEAIKELAKAVLSLQKDVKAQNQIFTDNLDFITGMGDVAEKMSDTLITIMDERDATLANVIEQFRTSTEFFKNTVSNKYVDQNIMQEWFSDMLVEVMSRNTPDQKYSISYVTEWTDLKFRSYKIQHKKLAATLPYLERVEFGENLFRLAQEELEVSDFGVFILRSMYIPFVSIYYLEPLFKYPYIQEYFKQLNKFRDHVGIMEEYEDDLKTILLKSKELLDNNE